MTVGVEGQAVPGGGAKFATNVLAIDGNRIQLVQLVWGPDGTIHFIDDSPGLRLPVKSVSCDTADAEVRTGDSTLNADRVTIVGGANVTEVGVDNAPFDENQSVGVPGLWYYNELAGLATTGAAGAARMNAYRIAYGAGLPRSLRVKGKATLTTTAEVTLIPAGAADVYHDIGFLSIYTDNINAPITAATKVEFRESTGGTVSYTIPIPEKGGSNVAFADLRWFQGTPASNWTVKLTAAMPTNGTPAVQSSVFVHAVAEVSRD